MFGCMDVSIYVCIYVYVYMNVYMFSYINVHGYMYMYIYIKTTQKISIIFEFYVKNQYRQEQELQ
jgi:hypothetical protein